MTKAVAPTQADKKPWSIFHQHINSYASVTADQGQRQAEAFAVALARKLFGRQGATGQQVQFIYDWEIAEGGGGFSNPLNAGPDPKHPKWSGGSQFGGGAAAYGNLTEGVDASADYLHMSNYSKVLAALKKNDISGARDALIASPWAASHYGGKLPTDKLPSRYTAGGFTPKGLPWYDSAAGAAGDAGKAAEGAVGTGLGDITGGIGGWLKSNIVIVALVIVVILIVKK